MKGINSIYNDTSLLELLYETNTKHSKNGSVTKSSGLDTATFSSEAMQMANSCKSSGSSVNTNLDNMIDIQSYLDEVNIKNQDAISNTGENIIANNNYTSLDQAYRAALNEKYSKLVATAKQHSDPADYIYQKYYNQSSSYYESDLSDTERQIAYHYEKNVLETGKVNGISMGDSLFRNIQENASTITDSTITFNRDMINAQIDNILQKNDITLQSDSSFTYSVDPYSYYITVSGSDSTLSTQIEQALNVDENGKNLYWHIRHCTVQDGVNSTQTSASGYEKYQMYQQVKDLTGIDISTLTERDGSYYTEDNENILDIVNKAVDTSEEIPTTHKSAISEWISQMVTDVATVGWDNIPDMVLQIDYLNGKLQDKYQDIQYGSN